MWQKKPTKARGNPSLSCPLVAGIGPAFLKDSKLVVIPNLAWGVDRGLTLIRHSKVMTPRERVESQVEGVLERRRVLCLVPTLAILQHACRVVIFRELVVGVGVCDSYMYRAHYIHICQWIRAASCPSFTGRNYTGVPHLAQEGSYTSLLVIKMSFVFLNFKDHRAGKSHMTGEACLMKGNWNKTGDWAFIVVIVSLYVKSHESKTNLSFWLSSKFKVKIFDGKIQQNEE